MTRAAPPAFPLDLLPAVAEDVADFFGMEQLAPPGQPIVVGPPIEAWVSGLENAADPLPSLRDTARWTERFHHQVLQGEGHPLGYALTRWLDDGIVVCKVSGAKDMACAVEEGLRVLRKRAAGEGPLRLLSVPELQLDALWLLDPRLPGEILMIRAPQESTVAPLDTLSEEDFMGVLMSHLPMAGVTVGLDEVLCDRAVRELIVGSFGEDASVNDAGPLIWEEVQMIERTA